MKAISLAFFLAVSLSAPLLAQTSNGTCLNSEPFCTDSSHTFPAGVGTGTAEVGPDYGCLLTQPNPAWFYMEIDQGGNLDIEMSNSANEDIDFIVWGPFADEVSPCTALLTAGNTVDCSYSTTATETINIAGATAGEHYILMTTNFSNNPTNITLENLPSSTANTDCSIDCPPVDFGVVNGADIDPLPNSLACNLATLQLQADETALDPGVTITPCMSLDVAPTNANPTLSVEFFEDGVSRGTEFPPANQNWHQFESFLTPNVSHAWILNEAVSSGTNMTYEVKDCHTQTVLATGTWIDDGSPQTVTVNPSPNLSGTAQFSITPAAGNPGLTSFTWGGADLAPSAIPVGSYDVTYSWNDDAGVCQGSATHSTDVTNPLSADFAYDSASYCVDAMDPTPLISGTPGGTFSASPAGLDLDTSTGQVDLSNSTAQSYTVTYDVSVSASCNASSDQSLTVLDIDDASFSYDMGSYCPGGPDPVPVISGLTGGTFSSTPIGLDLDGSSGAIDVSESLAGTYMVTYTTGGPCPNSSSVGVTIPSCDDGLYCNGTESCNIAAGICQAGTPPCLSPAVCSETNTECVPGPCSPMVIDLFQVQSFGNNDGPDDWNDNWIEDDPEAGGAGPAAGSVQITGGVLQLDDKTATGLEPSAAREVDLSLVASATLRFSFSTSDGVGPTDAVTVEASNNGGSSYSTLEVITGITGAVIEGRDYDLSAFFAANTRIRFRISGGYATGAEQFRIDFAQVDGCTVPVELESFVID